MLAAAIELDAVAVRRGTHDVLRGITATVPTGQVVGLLGPSGCGKTTLMRCIVGVQANVRGAVTMFVVTSVATLRERTSGTLERLLTLPIGKLDILLGYALAFGAVALVQTALVSALALGPLDLAVGGSTALVVVVALLSALLGNTLGLFTSAFARTEFQAVQFLPAFVIPQLLVCGLFVPRPRMPRPLQFASDVLPMTYVVDAMQRAVSVGDSGRLVLDLGVILGCVSAALGFGAVTLRRRTS